MCLPSCTSNDHAIACFGVLEPYLGRHISDATQAKDVAANAAVSIWTIVERNKVVGFCDNLDAQRRTMNEMDDFLYDEIRGERGVPLYHRGNGRNHRPLDAIGQTPDAGVKTMRQEIVFGTETIGYEIRFLPTRRTLGIEVHPDLSVIVRAPSDCDPAIIIARVGKRAPWISKQLTNFQRYSPRTPARQYVSGETHLYLGRQYRLKVGAGETAW